MKKTLVILKREYLTRVRTKAFVIGTLVTPFLLGMLSILPGFLATRGGGDRQITVLDQTGKSQFLELMASDGTVVFAAFDLVWLNGKDLRDAPLIERKELLRFRIRHPADRLLFVDYVEGKGKAFYARICGRDMEGMVCKPASSPYRTVGGKTTWIKVNNPGYSQAEGRAEQSHVLR